MKKRKMVDIWNDIDALNTLLRAGKHPRGDDILGIGTGNFYKCLMTSALRLRALKKKTQRNAQEWNFHDERIQLLKKIVGIHGDEQR